MDELCWLSWLGSTDLHGFKVEKELNTEIPTLFAEPPPPSCSVFQQGCSSSCMSSTGWFGFFSSSSLSSYQEGQGKKINLNTILVWRAKYQYLVSPFEISNLLGVLEAPAWVLCLTDVSLNPWWSGTPNQHESSVPRMSLAVTGAQPGSSLAAGILLADQDTPILAFLSGQDGLSSCGVSSEGRLSTAEHFRDRKISPHHPFAESDAL